MLANRQSPITVSTKGRKKPERKRQTEDSAEADDEASMPIQHVQKYSVEHLDVYSQHKLLWPPVFPESFQAKRACLSSRAQEILYLDEQLFGEAKDLECFRCRDLNMTMSWGNWRENITPCIVSTGILWLRGSCGGRTVDRLLSGRELLQMQGFDARKVSKTGHAFSQKEMVDLAGNAFCAPVLYAVVTGLVACVPWATAFRAKHIPQTLAKPAAIPLQVPPADIERDVPDNQLDDEDLSFLEEEGGESEEMEDASMAGEIGESSGESIGSLLVRDD